MAGLLDTLAVVPSGGFDQPHMRAAARDGAKSEEEGGRPYPLEEYLSAGWTFPHAQSSCNI